jgi:hypothetical protein
MAAAVIGLEPIFPTMALAWLPVLVMPVDEMITKFPADKRSTGAGLAATAERGPAKPATKREAASISSEPLVRGFICVFCKLYLLATLAKLIDYFM